MFALTIKQSYSLKVRQQTEYIYIYLTFSCWEPQKQSDSSKEETDQIHFSPSLFFVFEAQLNETMQAWNFLMETVCFSTLTVS